MASRKHILFYGLLALLVFVVAEFASFMVVKYLAAKGTIYWPRVSDRYENYLSLRDALLGWPSPEAIGNGGYDSSGSRVIPAFPEPTVNRSCIALYGDSFTWSSAVDHAHAWGNVLSKLVGCRVANFGVGGYGSDQAYLRFRQNTQDQAPIVFLNHLSENILRNVNQFRDLLYPGGGLGFKPRFILNDLGELELITLPTFPARQYEEVVLHPEQFFQYDYFVPDGRSGTIAGSFPYTLSLLNSLGHFHVIAELRNEPWYMDFYRANHPAKGLQLTSTLLKAFYDDAKERGRLPVVTIIPTGADLTYYSEKDAWPYAALIDDLSAKGVPVLNFGEAIMNKLAGTDPCILFDDCSSHYNERGYALLARVAYEWLQESKLMEKIDGINMAN